MHPETQRTIAAATWMLGSIAGFSAIAVSGREIGAALDTFEMMLYRSLIGVAVISSVVVLTGRRHEVGTEALGGHLLRNLLHFAGQNLWLYALALIPLAQLFALEFSAPVMVALAAPLVLSERLTPARALSAVLGFAGVLIVARPGAPGALSAGIVAALLSAVAFAGTALVTKRLTRRMSVLCILFWLALMQSTFGAVAAGWDGRIALPSPPALPWVVVMGLAGLLAHLCLTKALSLAPASVVTPIDFLRLPLIGLVGWAAYGEPLDPWVFAGGAVIFAANWLNIRAETRCRNVTETTESDSTSRH